jgi:ribosomal protein L11 methyltransferase
MPYRIDLRGAVDPALGQLIELGALDVEHSDDGTLSALMPDSVEAGRIARMLGVDEISVSPATGRDAESVWVLRPRPIQIGRLQIVPAHVRTQPDALRLIATPAFGTGLHPTTALCLEALDQAVHDGPPAAVLDVGTGSGVLALGGLMLGVPRALGIDIDDKALGAAAANARINGVAERLQLVHGGPETVSGAWPLVFANILAAPLIEMAPALVRRVGHRGVLVLSGIPRSVEQDVVQAYRYLGMRLNEVKSREGWIALVLQASW